MLLGAGHVLSPERCADAPGAGARAAASGRFQGLGFPVWLRTVVHSSSPQICVDCGVICCIGAPYMGLSQHGFKGSSTRNPTTCIWKAQVRTRRGPPATSLAPHRGALSFGDAGRLGLGSGSAMGGNPSGGFPYETPGCHPILTSHCHPKKTYLVAKM